jgi:hypothetical protein
MNRLGYVLELVVEPEGVEAGTLKASNRQAVRKRT